MGNSVVQKDVLAKYVHDAVEMETAIYTLDKMKENQLQHKDEVIREKKQHVEQTIHEYDLKQDKANEAHETLEIYRNYYKQQKPEEIQLPQKQKTNSFLLILFDREHYEANWILKIFTLFMLGFPVWGLCVVIFMSIFTSIGIKDTEIPSYIAASIATLLFITLLIIRKRKKEKIKAKDHQDRQDRITTNNSNRNLHIWSLEEEYKDALETAKNFYSKVNEARNELQKAQKYCESIDKQIAVISEKRNAIRKNLDQFYVYGLIPPDYRTFDCVMMLDQIFRNDLADNMRDAILLYEDRVFKGAVIKGMDRICSMLGRLSSEMSAISLRLDMINSSVAQMGDDLSRANQRLMNNQRELIEQSIKNRTATEELINETKLGRYTNEKLLESNKRLEYYAEEYRMGRMPRDNMN